jgi:integrase
MPRRPPSTASSRRFAARTPRRAPGLLLLVPSITTLREDNVRTGFLDPDQVEAVCAAFKKRDVEADMVGFCYYAGWRRRSEVFPLTWAQVDWAGGFVRLEPGTTKNREERSFPITPAFRAVLERRLDFTRRCERTQGRIIPWVFHRKGERIQSM